MTGAGEIRRRRARRAALGCAAAGLAALILAGGPASGQTRGEAALELVESHPIETTLDHPDIPDAAEVWPEMIAGARASLDFAEFYASDEPGSRLGPVIAAVEAAAARGVRVRFLAEKSFRRTYPETLERLSRRPGIEVRLLDLRDATGGVLHAKYFVVDGREAYLGSQNFDWRALEHIQELGVRMREPRLAASLAAIFEGDWRWAGRDAAGEAVEGAAGGVSWGEGASGAAGSTPLLLACDGDTLRVRLVASPTGWLPDGVAWDLPQLLESIAGARERLRVQLLTYRAVGRDGEFFGELESALRAAAARGVGVQLLLADWCLRPGTIEGLQSLEPLPGIEVRLMTIPPWSGGFIPFARVVHAKYMVADGKRAWIGTSNWEKDYFHASRNAGLLIEGGGIPARLDRFFEENWNGPYAWPIDPCAAYAPPRIAE